MEELTSAPLEPMKFEFKRRSPEKQIESLEKILQRIPNRIAEEEMEIEIHDDNIKVTEE